MAKQLNVSLAFTADTGKAKAQLQDLQNQLDKLISGGGLGGKRTDFILTRELQQATTAAATLKTNLQAAIDVNTGKLDLSKFQAQMNKSKMSLEEYRNQLVALGPDGAKAFASLADSIYNADVVLKRSNRLLTEMKTTLMNTARWQLSSSMLHGFMGAVQGAFGYAKDLNESLNNIRIVTGQNIDQMAKFAEEANKAAKALSTTTTNYTNASLIYYQQGLDGQAVKDRADITIKLANVAKISAETASDQLTAIWNNFAKGSENLEHFADVLVKLGAETASSSDEISAGLEKFAAIGDTVGLSFNNAAAALATVTATTRQSADVVGTAFKTIFARIQGLNLGETLEDGTTLNKYSEALSRVGINIKDQSGELKTMDALLEEMGTKWQTLNRDQQTALAQTVAGVRQYTQLMALMNNWDFYKQNLNTAANADGALDEQQKIYEESWEAAHKRVQAAAQTIYSELIDDEFFITLLDGFKEILEYVDHFIDALGGLKGVLSVVGTLLIKSFSNEIASKIDNIGMAIRRTAGGESASAIAMKKKAVGLTANMGSDSDTNEGMAMNEAYNARQQAQTLMLNNANRLSEAEKSTLQILMDGNKALGEQVILQGKLADEAAREADNQERSLKLKHKTLNGKTNSKKVTSYKEGMQDVGKAESISGAISNATKSLSTGKTKGSGLDGLLENAKNLQTTLGTISSNPIFKGNSNVEKTSKSVETLHRKLTEIAGKDIISQQDVDDLTRMAQQADQMVADLSMDMQENGAEDIIKSAGLKAGGKQSQDLQNLGETARDAGLKAGQASVGMTTLGQSVKTMGDYVDGAQGKVMTLGQKITAAAQTVTTTIMVFNMLKGAIDTIKDPEMTGWEKFLSIMGTVAMAIPMVVSTVTALAPAFMGAGAAGMTGGTMMGAGMTAAMGPIGWIIAAVTALIALFVGLAIAAEQNSPEAQLAKTAKTAEELSENLEEVRKEAQEIKDTFDKYDSLIDKLNNCAKGTKEWYEALEEVNNCALDLLEKYPDLAKYEGLFTRKDGMLTIDPNVVENIIKDLDNQVNSATAAALLSSADVAQKKADNLTAETRSSIGSFIGTDYTMVGQGREAHRQYETVKAGEILVEHAEELANLTEKEYETKIKALVDQAAKDVSMTEEQYQNMIKALMEDQEAINQLVRATQNAATQMDNATLALANQTLANKGYENAEVMMASMGLESQYQTIYDEIITKGRADWQSEGTTTNSKDIWKRFEEATGKDYQEIDNTVQGSAANRVYAYKDDAGKEQTFSLEYMAKTIAAHEALQDLEMSAKEAGEALVNVEQVNRQYAETMEGLDADAITAGVKDWVTTGSFGDMTEADFAGLQDVVEGAGGVDAYLQQAFGMSADELAVAFGDDYVDRFTNSMTNYTDDLSEVGKDLLEKAQVELTALDTSKLTLNQKNAVGEMINAAIVNTGSADAFTNLFNQIPVEQTDEFAEVLSNVDWQTTDINQLKDSLYEAGISTVGFDDELQNLIDTMDNSGIQAAASLGASYKNLTDITEGLQTGDTISAEDYGKLDEGMQRYFTMMMDGTYALTGSAQEFQELVHKQGISSYQENIQKLGEQAAGYNRIKGYDIDALKDAQYEKGEGYSSSGVKQQLDILDVLGYDPEQLAKWREDASDFNMSHENLDAITAAVQGYSHELENLDVLIEENKQAVFGQEMAIAMSYQSLSDLTKAYEEGVVSVQAYNTAAIALNEKEDLEGLDTEELEEYAEYLQEICDESEELSSELDDNDEAARDVAKTILKMNKGIEALAEGYDDWADVIKNSSKESEEYCDAVNGMRDALSDVLDVSEDYISSDFMAGHLEDIKLAAEGNADAIDRLKAALADQIILDIVGVDKFADLPSGLQTAINEMQSIISSTSLKVGDTLDMSVDDTGFIEACNEIIKNANMTADQANAYFDALGFETNFVTEPQLQTQRVPEYVTETIDEGSTTVTLADGTEVPMVRTRTRTYQDGYYEAEGMVDAIAMATSTDGSTQVPQIQSITKKPSGSSNNYSSKNSGGAKSPGSKGGGGGDKKAKKESKKSAKTETERYHVIENQLENLKSQYDEISKAKDRAFGKAKLALMDKEIAKQKEIIAKQKEYLSQAEKNLSTDAAALGKYNATIVDGVVTNYDSMVAAQVQKYNDAVEKYNALSAEAQEKLDEEWSNKKDENGQYYNSYLDYYEREYENFTEALSQYEETQDLVRDKQQEIIDAQNELYDLQLEKIDYKVQVQIDIEDDELQYLEYMLERIENKAFSAAEAIANLGQQTQSYMTKNQVYEQGVKDIFANHGLTNEDFNKFKAGDEATLAKLGQMEFTDDEVQTLRDYTSSLIDTNQSLIETRQAVHDKLLSAFEEMNEELDKGIDKLEALSEMTESYRTIVDLVGKANFAGGNETIAEINKATVAQAKNIAQAKIAKRDALAADIEYAEKQYALQKDNISEEERKMWEDSIAEMKVQLTEAKQEARDSITDWMEEINKDFQDSITAALDKFSETVAGRFSSIAELSDAFGRAQTKNDRYLEDYQKIYEFSKLTRDIEKSIDDTDNIRAKKELRKLLEEINEIEESGAQVSEYQVENLRKQFELKQAELALEEVKDAKSQVRMTRDNNGNWGYVYTANDQDVAAAEQSYEDKLYELQEHNAEYINQLQESIITMQQEMADKLAEIAADEALSIEERQAKMDEVRRFYQEQMGYYNSELNLALNNNKTLYEDDWMAYSERTGYKISADEDYVDSFEETDYAILTGFQNMEQSQLAFNQASQTMLDESNIAFITWKDQMKDALDEADLNFDTLKEDIKEDLGEIVEESNTTTEEIKEDAKEMVEDYQTVVDAIVEWETQYSTSVEQMIIESDKIITKFNEVLRLWGEVKSAAEQGVPEPPSSSETPSSTPSGSPDSGDDGMPPDNSSKAEGVAAAIWMDGGAASGWYNGSDRRSRLAEKGVTAAQAYINAHGPNGDIYRTWASKRGQLRNFYYGSFDTGGYTGEWGSEGRFAMLHEKELVLNPADTENLLSAVNLIREISSIIDLNAMSASLGLTSLLGIGKIGTSRESLEQTVTIHAEFPGVTDRNEIEEAFSNLINTASQYANRKS